MKKDQSRGPLRAAWNRFRQEFEAFLDGPDESALVQELRAIVNRIGTGTDRRVRRRSVHAPRRAANAPRRSAKKEKATRRAAVVAAARKAIGPKPMRSREALAAMKKAGLPPGVRSQDAFRILSHERGFVKHGGRGNGRRWSQRP